MRLLCARRFVVDGETPTQTATEAAMALWETIEKLVPRDRDPTLGGLLK